MRRAVYALGFRPRLGSIWHSPTLDLVYYFKDSNFAEVFREALNSRATAVSDALDKAALGIPDD